MTLEEIVMGSSPIASTYKVWFWKGEFGIVLKGD